MNTEEELQEKIEKLMTVIRENYPDLEKSLKMASTNLIATDRNNTDGKLIEDYDNLVCLFRDYVADHQLQNPNRIYNNHHL